MCHRHIPDVLGHIRSGSGTHYTKLEILRFLPDSAIHPIFCQTVSRIPTSNCTSKVCARAPTDIRLHLERRCVRKVGTVGTVLLPLEFVIHLEPWFTLSKLQLHLKSSPLWTLTTQPWLPLPKEIDWWRCGENMRVFVSFSYRVPERGYGTH